MSFRVLMLVLLDGPFINEKGGPDSALRLALEPFSGISLPLDPKFCYISRLYFEHESAKERCRESAKLPVSVRFLGTTYLTQITGTKEPSSLICMSESFGLRARIDGFFFVYLERVYG